MLVGSRKVGDVILPFVSTRIEVVQEVAEVSAQGHIEPAVRGFAAATAAASTATTAAAHAHYRRRQVRHPLGRHRRRPFRLRRSTAAGPPRPPPASGLAALARA